MKIAGESHPDVAASLDNLASVLQEQGKLEEPQHLHREGQHLTWRLPEEHAHRVVASQNRLAKVLQQHGKLG